MEMIACSVTRGPELEAEAPADCPPAVRRHARGGLLPRLRGFLGRG